MRPGKINSNEEETVLFRGLTSARLRLGLATVALASLSHASSAIDIQAAGQTAAPSWLETLVLDGPPQDGVLAVRGDRDYFRVAVTGAMRVAIYTSGPVNTIGRLYDPDGREIAADNYSGEGGNFRIDTVLPRAGTYYVRVEADSDTFAGRSAGAYTIRSERLESPQPLSLGGSAQEDAIETGNDVDYFRLQVTEPTLAAIYTTGGFDGKGALLDPDGREIASDYDGGEGRNFRIEALLPRRGAYHLRLERGFLADPGDYTLHADRLAPPTRLTLGGPPQQGAISTDGEVDYFRMSVTGPTLASIYTGLDYSEGTGLGALTDLLGDVTPSSWDFDGKGTLLGPDGRELASDDNSGEGANFRIEAFLPRAGTYYLRIEAAGFSSRTGSYTLRAERLESPRQLSLGGPPHQSAYSIGDKTDFVRIAVTGPTLASFFTSGDLDIRGALLGPDGREIASDDDSGVGLNFRIDRVLPRAGTYHLRVETRYRIGSYTLHAERLKAPRQLSLGGPPHQGALLAHGEPDFFHITVPEPIDVAIHTTGGLDSSGDLYDADGELIASEDDGGEGLNFQIDTVLFQRGTYLIKILPSHPDSTGSYGLHAAVSGGGSVSAGGSGGVISPPAAEFDLDPENTSPGRIAFANGRLYVVDADDDKVYVYDVSGQRVPAAEFDLEDRFVFARGITFARGRFHVADPVGDEVLVFDTSGQRVPAAEFDLDPDNDDPFGITFGNGRFYVVDDTVFDINKVFAHQASGQRVPAAKLDLDRDNDDPHGITFGNGRFYVVDWRDDKAYAYKASGQRVPAADFDLKPGNSFPTGITFGNGRFYVVDGIRERVYTY